MEHPQVLDDLLHDPQSLRNKLVVFLEHLKLVENVAEDELNYFNVLEFVRPFDGFLHSRHETFLLMLPDRNRVVLLYVFESTKEHLKLLQMCQCIRERQKGCHELHRIAVTSFCLATMV